MTAFEEMQKHYRQRDLAAKEWKKNSGKVVGYFCDNVPEELILAAGFFPIRLSGDPKGGMDVARKNLLIRYSTREDFVHSMFNMLLTGKYDYLDYLVIPHARDSIHRLYQLMVEMKQSNPAWKFPVFIFLDTTHIPSFPAVSYDHDRMIEFKEKLEAWSGKKITNEALSKAIATTNENKVLLKKVAELRSAEPPRISGVEALQIIGSSMFMLKEEHNKLLKKYLEGASNLPARDGTRIFVDGSPLDNLQLYEIIESFKATVVADDNCWGNRYSDVLIDTVLPPMEAIVDRYNRKSPCPRMYPINRLVDYCRQSAVDAKAQKAICYVYENDGAETWLTREKVKALEEKGISTVSFMNQPYLISNPEELKTSIGKLVSAI
jgi:benzoyl-CoA reductase/2-hydroxyglutaryl-CoA dehydratase subunit BcrC/BadD/HgdB